MGTAKENIGAAHDRCAAGQKERAGRVRPEMYESAPLGKFKSVDALLQAYNSLQAEFTRRSRRLRELEGKLAENAASPAPAGESEEPAPGENALRAAGQATTAAAPAEDRETAGGETPAEDAAESGKQAAARESASGQCGAGIASAAQGADRAGLEQGEAAVSGGTARGGEAVPVSAIEEAVERAVRRAAAAMPYLMPGGSAFAAAPPRRIGSIEEAGRLARDMMGRGSR